MARSTMGSRPNQPAVRAILFDLDGLLINTEDCYVQARQMVIRQNGGWSTPIPWALTAEMQSVSSAKNGATTMQFGGLDLRLDHYQQQFHDAFISLIPQTKRMPGVDRLFEIVDRLESPPRIALASSSSTKRFEAKAAFHPGLLDRFPAHLRVLSGDDPVLKEHGKPEPDIFLHALAAINSQCEPNNKIAVDECLVFEDSKAGVIGAMAAGMRVVWIPHPEIRKVHQGREGDFLARPLGAATYRVYAWIDKLKVRVVPIQEIPASMLLCDGQVELLDSMESFDPTKYGLH